LQNKEPLLPHGFGGRCVKKGGLKIYKFTPALAATSGAFPALVALAFAFNDTQFADAFLLSFGRARLCQIKGRKERIRVKNEGESCGARQSVKQSRQGQSGLLKVSERATHAWTAAECSKKVGV